MKKFLKLAVICLIFLFLEGCDKKEIVNGLVNLVAMGQICLSDPLKYSFDPANPNEIKVSVSFANGNYDDVSGKLELYFWIYDKNGVFVGRSTANFTTTPCVFPKNTTGICPTEFIVIKTLIPLKINETYIIKAKKFVIGYTETAKDPLYNNSCYFYNYSIPSLEQQGLTNIATGQICLSDPFKYSFDPANPNEIKVSVSFANGNNSDVFGKLGLDFWIRDKNGVYLGGTLNRFTTKPCVFPKNKTGICPTEFIVIKTLIPLKINETYIIKAKKIDIGYIESAKDPLYNNSCYFYSYSIPSLK